MTKYEAGDNHPIFEGKYAIDLGRNQFSGSELWHWPHDAPVTFDFTKPEANPAAPLLTTQPALIDKYFQSVHGIDVTRIWLLERLEGIRFDNNSKIIGIDSDLLNNLGAILDSADNHGVKVYLCLLDSWVVKNDPPPGLSPARLGLYNTWNATIRNIMKSIVDHPEDFVSNVLDPLVDAIANHPAVYAIDVMNEPEGMTEDTAAVSNSSMRNFVSQCCSVIRPSLQASVGCMRNNTAKSYSNLPIDFCDFHSYNDTGNLPSYNPARYNGKPCMIGECGFPVSSSNSAARSMHEVQTAKDFVNEAHSRGYSGCLVWTKDFTSQTNIASITQWLQQFSGQNNQVMPPPPTSPFAAFLAWLAALLGGNP
jgi:hypothetical protein